MGVLSNHVTKSSGCGGVDVFSAWFVEEKSYQREWFFMKANEDVCPAVQTGLKGN